MKLQDQIGKDETILWSGKKHVFVSFLESIFNPLMPFALIWGLFDFSFIHLIGSTEADVGTGFGFIPVFFLIHLMPVWLYLGGILSSAFRAKHTEYCVTDKAVYVQHGLFSTTVDRREYTDFTQISLKQGLFDKMFSTGDVVAMCNDFSTVRSRRGTRTVQNKLEICNVADYQAVYDIVRDQQSAFSPARNPVLPDAGYGTPNPGFQMQSPGYGTPNPGFQMQSPGYGTPNPGFQTQTPGYGTPNPGFNMTNPAAAPRPAAFSNPQEVMHARSGNMQFFTQPQPQPVPPAQPAPRPGEMAELDMSMLSAAPSAVQQPVQQPAQQPAAPVSAFDPAQFGETTPFEQDPLSGFSDPTLRFADPDQFRDPTLDYFDQEQ